MEPLEVTMTLPARLKRIGRLAIAPIKGFFCLKTKTTTPHFDPERTTLWAHLKEVARQDTILYFEPFTNAIRYFREERAKGLEVK
jgi:hypothetical protein